jgi:hypothetical protein
MAEKPIKLFASRSEQYPEPEDIDKAHGALRVVLSAIPGIGSPLTELLSMVLAPSVVRRHDDWLKNLAGDFDRLESKVDGFKMQNLADNEPFISAAIQATRIAIGTHHQEKREMLRNALLNVAVGKGPQEELQEVFFAAIESLSPLHMRILKFYWTGLSELAEASKWDAMRPYELQNYSTAIGELHPDLKRKEDVLLYIMTDLKNRGFSTVGRPADSFPQSPAITNMGVQFLQFVLVPPV